MLRRSLVFIAATAIAAFIAAAPAQAAWRVIKWNITGVCQVWDFGVDGTPVPGDFRVLSRPLPTFGAALSAKERLWNRGACTL